MIKFDLNVPVYTIGQLKYISMLTSIDLRDLTYVGRYTKQVVTKENGKIPIGGIIRTYNTEDDTGLAVDVDGGLTGVEGVKWLAEHAGSINLDEYDIAPVTMVRISSKVLHACAPDTWYDISALVSRIYDKNERYAKLCELRAPKIIMLCEARLICEAVQALEDNGYYKPITYSNDNQPYSLKDTGFSLLCGKPTANQEANG